MSWQRMSVQGGSGRFAPVITLVLVSHLFSPFSARLQAQAITLPQNPLVPFLAQPPLPAPAVTSSQPPAVHSEPPPTIPASSGSRDDLSRDPPPRATHFLPDDELLSLKEQERALLEDYGPDYFQVRNVRARIKAVEEFIAAKKADAARRAALKPAPENVHIIAGPRASMSKHRNVGQPWSSMKYQPASRLPEEPDRHEAAPAADAGHGVATVPATKLETTRTQTASSAGSASTAGAEEQEATAPAGTVWGPFTVLHLVAAVVGLVIGLVIHIFIVLWMVARFSAKQNPQGRLETPTTSVLATSHSFTIAEAAGIAADQPLAEAKITPPQPLLHRPMVKAATAPEPVWAPAPIEDSDGYIEIQEADLLRTYDEELKDREKRAAEREELVLRQFFEQNRVLREKIDELEAVAA